MPIRFLLTLVIGSAALPSAMSEEVSKNLRLTLPTEMYAVVGVELSVYFDNVVLTEANAGLTAEAAENMENAVIDAVQATIRRTHPQLATVANPHAWPPRALHR